MLYGVDLHILFRRANRFCITENHLESTTKAYLLEIGNQLEQIKGIKK